MKILTVTSRRTGKFMVWFGNQNSFAGKRRQTRNKLQRLARPTRQSRNFGRRNFIQKRQASFARTHFAVARRKIENRTILGRFF